MNTQKHTQGPWHFGWGRVNDQQGKTIAFLQPRKDRHNGNLIAAAPEMLDALQAIVDAFGDQDSLLIDQCKAALGKATGKQ